MQPRCPRCGVFDAVAGDVCAYCAETATSGREPPPGGRSVSTRVECAVVRYRPDGMIALVRQSDENQFLGTSIGNNRTGMGEALNIIGQDGWRPYSRVDDRDDRHISVWVSREIPTRVEYAEVWYCETTEVWFLCIPGRNAIKLDPDEIVAIGMAAADGWHPAGSTRGENHLVVRHVSVP